MSSTVLRFVVLDTFEFGFALFPRGSHVYLAFWNWTPLILAAAYWIALTMFW